MEMVDTALRGLMGAAAAASEGNLTLTAPLVSGKNPFGLHGVAGVMGPSHDNHEGVCVCLDYYPHGSQYEKVFAIVSATGQGRSTAGMRAHAMLLLHP